MKMGTIPYTRNNNVITVFDNDYVPVSIDTSHPNFDLVLALIANECSLDDVLEAMKPIETVRKAVDGTNITVTDDSVLYNGSPVHGLLVDRILGNDEVTHLVRFLDNLMLNPSYRAVQELYGFLEKNNHMIAEDGSFLAYKIVAEDYKDLHSRTFDNSPGKLVWVNRNQVDEDSTVTCSRGLHVCAFEYLNAFGSVRSGTDRVVVVSVNPRDVVAVPNDYNNSKMRVCQYRVLKDITDKVKDTIGLDVGRDHALDYGVDEGFDYRPYLDTDDYDDEEDDLDQSWTYRKEWLDSPDSYGFEDDYDAYLEWLVDTDRLSLHDYEKEDYMMGYWIEHTPTAPTSDGRGEMPLWVEPDDKLMVEWNDGDDPSGPYSADCVHGWSRDITRYRKVG